MDRKKPSLTSPWKVGFLVALLLVVTALGVSYFITGTFSITWHWVHFGGLSPATWTFNPGAFLEEMAPLLLLTALLAFAAYVLVAGAVRRYKAYVDSGAEYKQLLKSIKSMEDLQDEALADRLKQHPELREFLLGLRHRVSTMEKNGERDRKHSQNGGSAPREERSRLQSECSVLASAITSGRDAFARELALTVPELKQVERAVREAFANTPEAPVAAPARSAELDRLRASVRDTATSIRRDVDACASGARELEEALGGLSAALQGGKPAPGTNNNTAVQKRIDLTAEALGALGEEARRLAIASAMQAAGGPGTDEIKVADELRTLATRFNTVAQHWRETAPALKELLGGDAAGGRASQDGVAAIAATAVSRARLWSERMIAMTEHVRALENALRDGDAEPAPAPALSTMDLADDAVAAVPGPVFTSNATEDFAAPGTADVFASDTETDTSFVDIPGFEKERRFFADAPSSAVELADDRFVVDRADATRWDLTDTADEPAAETVASAQASERANDADGFLTGPRPVVSPKKIARPGTPQAPRAAAPAAATAAESQVFSATATLDADADAVGLYELGAVDCVQTT